MSARRRRAAASAVAAIVAALLCALLSGSVEGARSAVLLALAIAWLVVAAFCIAGVLRTETAPVEVPDEPA